MNARHLLALRSFPAFAKLDLGELGALTQTFDEELLVRGSVLPPAVYFILDGRIATRGRTVSAGALGAVELLAGAAGGLDAVAETDVLVLTAEHEAVLDLLEDSFALLRAATVSFARQVLERGGLEPFAERRPLPALPERRLDLGERLRVVASHAWLEGARLEALFELGRVADEVTLEPGASLWRRGDPSDAAWFLLDGTVEPTAAAGQIAGAVEMLAEQPRAADAIARTPVRALRIPAAGLLDVIEDAPDLGLHLLRLLAATILQLEEMR